VSCGKERCTRCAEGPAHGPYWYRYYRRGGKVVSKYVGKALPAADAAFLERPSKLRHKADAPAPDRRESSRWPAGPEGTGAQIREAWRALVSGDPWTASEFISVTDLRRMLPGIPRAELDAELDRMYRNQEINLVAQANQEILTDADREAAIRLGGNAKHKLSFPYRDPEDDDPRAHGA
jgi:hypothetical protein